LALAHGLGQELVRAEPIDLLRNRLGWAEIAKPKPSTSNMARQWKRYETLSRSAGRTARGNRAAECRQTITIDRPLSRVRYYSAALGSIAR
jgi:hypothetical protein